MRVSELAAGKRVELGGATLHRVDDETLKKFWPTAMTDKEMAARLGHHRSVLRRAAERLGLPPRRFARWRELIETASRRAV
jgi:hypothetical protein